MTQQEHLLMVGMFAKQLQLFKALADILRSNGIIVGDDFAAFLSVVRQDTAESGPMVDAVREQYRTIAARVGVGEVLP